ncbi:MAG TPA: vWA domain-containing protein, partial [Fibrobacteria bacterium]|nr:vWA domain-containing protein [Fibrobacteria bacterium]
MLPIALSPARLHPEPRPASRSGVFRPGTLHAMLTLVLLGVGSAWPQARRCDLVGRDTVVSGVGYKRCLDLSALDGDTLIIPSNVTRIDNDGLSLCKSSVQSGGNADIIYVYDNSGSMRSSYAWINSSGTDTLYYENTYGCSNSSTDGTVNFTVYNASGTGSVTRTAYRLVSNTGCTSTSGDPYYARGRAMRLGIEYQAQRAPTSSAGIMSFTNSVANVRRPLFLNSAANISSIQSGINVVSDGGTNYRAPLDSSKRWLTTSITSNPRKAIIFLSDGRHNDGANYRAVLDSAFDRSRGFGGAMPPIYGIFLGRPIADTANLAELSSRTGGQFFLIPSNRPDSLISVVERILDIVLREFEPTTATVSNARTGQSATSTAPGGFATQTAGSWLMRLNNVIALGVEDTNRITVTTQFRERHSGTLENQTVSFLLMTTAAPASGSGVITSTQFARTCYDRSSLRILNRAGADPTAFSEGDDAYQPVLRTSPIDLPSAAIGSSTRLEEDRESPTLSTRTAYPESTVFRSTLPFVVLNSNTNGNGTLEAATFDTMVVTWVHPRDSQDIASDTMPVRAGNRA